VRHYVRHADHELIALAITLYIVALIAAVWK